MVRPGTRAGMGARSLNRRRATENPLPETGIRFGVWSNAPRNADLISYLKAYPS